MTDENNSHSKISSVLKKAIIIAVIIGILIALPLVINALRGEYYSSLYLLPESYTNYPDSNITTFSYGIKCHEKDSTNYYADFYLDDQYLKRDNIRLSPGECVENNISITIDDIVLPAKVNVVLLSPYDSYKVGYWIKESV